jgi:hypothetical protein
MFANKGIPAIFLLVQISFWTIGMIHIYQLALHYYVH